MKINIKYGFYNKNYLLKKFLLKLKAIEKNLNILGQYEENLFKDLKFYYNNLRWYKNNIGRYIRSDSDDYFSFFVDDNLYSYSENNPITKYDITGHYIIDKSCRCSTDYDWQMIQKGIRILKEIKIPRADVRSCVNNKFDPASTFTIECGRSCSRDNEGYKSGIELMGLCPKAFEEGQCEIVATLAEEALHACFWVDGDEMIGVTADIEWRCKRYMEEK